ncbi:MAG: aminopeptidase, partial [Phycisphaerae bacterium]|nr:aminopeptidase [Phycisphaerae bacterium]
MLDPRVEKMAQVLVRYSASVKPGDLVSIKGTTLAEPLVLALLEETLKAGGHPRIRLSPTGSPEILYKNASDEQLKFISELDRQEVEQLDVSIRVIASANTRALSNIDPARPAMLSQARKDLSQRFLQRAADGELRWTLTAYPTLAYAQEAEMSLSEYEDFVYRACLLHHKDPVTAWKKLAEQQQRVADYLDKCKELRIRATDTDIRFGIEGRKWINCLGDKNFPDGEVFTGPLEDSVEGHIRYSFPAIREGRHVDDIRLTFKAGKAVEATAVKNQDFL